jgi:hypothetical protein
VSLRLLISNLPMELASATLELTRAALEGSASLGRLLGARVPASWPPEYPDRAALEFTIARLEEGLAQAGWWLHFVVLRGGGATDRMLIPGGFDGVEPALKSRLTEIDQIRPKPQYNRFGLRIAEATVVFQHAGRTIESDHQSRVQKARVTMPFLRHTAHGG